MKYVVEINGARHEVEVRGTTVLVDDVEVAAELRPVAGTPVRLVRIGEAVHRVVARRGATRGRWTLDVDGAGVEVEALDERTRVIRDLTAASAIATGPAPLTAPMPGLVVRIAVAVGDTVSTGQGLVVMEAMKMENELRASAAGVVQAIQVTPGQAVEKGAVLVTLAPLE